MLLGKNEKEGVIPFFSQIEKSNSKPGDHQGKEAARLLLVSDWDQKKTPPK